MTQAIDNYKENGYTDRNHYLSCVAQDFDVDEGVVFALADVLGPDEDFDGLIFSLEDMEGEY